MGGILAGWGNGIYSHYLFDFNGNVQLVLSPEQNIVERCEYEPFGERFRNTQMPCVRYGFSSKEWDGLISSFYYGFRYYNPLNMKWLSRDVIGERGGLNLYEFVADSPCNYVDPLGQKELCSVTAYLTHGASDTDSYDRVPAIPRNLPETQKWGFWGCYADRYNKKVPETNRIGFPPVNENEMWPPKVPDPNGSGAMVERPPCDNVADLLNVGKAIRGARDELCQKKCCSRVQMNIQMDYMDPRHSFSNNVESAKKRISSGDCEGDINDLPVGGMGWHTCQKKEK